jgi:hypothetical protein
MNLMVYAQELVVAALNTLMVTTTELTMTAPAAAAVLTMVIGV